MSRLVYLCVAMIVLLGCVPPPLPANSPDSDAFYTVFHADKAFTPRQVEALEAACAAWAGFTNYKVVCTVALDQVGPVFPILDQPMLGMITTEELAAITAVFGAPQGILGFTYGKSFILVTDMPGMQDMEYFKQVAMHEIGHTLGFHHEAGEHCDNLMYPYACANQPARFGKLDWEQCVQLGYCRDK